MATIATDTLTPTTTNTNTNATDTATLVAIRRPRTSKPRGICRYYTTPRGCFAGSTCKFLHAAPAADSAISGGGDAASSSVSGESDAANALVGGVGELEGNGEPVLTPYDAAKRCVYYAKGFCRRGDTCWFNHSLPPPPPYTSELCGAMRVYRTESEWGAAQGRETCCICLEVPVTFGLLEGCNHVFCISCIKTWRNPTTSPSPYDDPSSSMKKNCPLCRVPSKFVVPSSMFFASLPEEERDVYKVYRREYPVPLVVDFTPEGSEAGEGAGGGGEGVGEGGGEDESGLTEFGVRTESEQVSASRTQTDEADRASALQGSEEPQPQPQPDVEPPHRAPPQNSTPSPPIDTPHPPPPPRPWYQLPTPHPHPDHPNHFLHHRALTNGTLPLAYRRDPKGELIRAYKESMKRIPCKHFVASGRRRCKFGKGCFYKHEDEQGGEVVLSGRGEGEGRGGGGRRVGRGGRGREGFVGDEDAIADAREQLHDALENALEFIRGTASLGPDGEPLPFEAPGLSMLLESGALVVDAPNATRPDGLFTMDDMRGVAQALFDRFSNAIDMGRAGAGVDAGSGSDDDETAAPTTLVADSGDEPGTPANDGDEVVVRSGGGTGGRRGPDVGTNLSAGGSDLGRSAVNGISIAAATERGRGNFADNAPLESHLSSRSSPYTVHDDDDDDDDDDWTDADADSDSDADWDLNSDYDAAQRSFNITISPTGHPGTAWLSPSTPGLNVNARTFNPGDGRLGASFCTDGRGRVVWSGPEGDSGGGGTGGGGSGSGSGSGGGSV